MAAMFRGLALSGILLTLCFTNCMCQASDTSAQATTKPILQLNETSGNILGNIFGLLSGFLNDTNGQAGLGNFINGLLQGGTGETKWPTKGTTGNVDSRSNDSFGALQQLLPILATTGFSDPMRLIPVLLSYLQSADRVLEASGVSSECRNDLSLWYEGLQKFEGWAWKLIDSGFKIPSNIASLNLAWLGDMDECTDINTNVYSTRTKTVEHFGGKYCRLIFPLGDLGTGSPQFLILGSCASKRCSSGDVKIIVDTALGVINPTEIPLQAIVSCLEDKPELDSKVIAVICVLGVLGALVVAGTLYDVIAIQWKSEVESDPPVLLSATPKESPPPYMAYVVMPEDDTTIGGPVIIDNEKDAMPSEGKIAKPAKSFNLVDETKKQKQPQSVFGKLLLAFSVYTNGCKLLGTTQGSGSLGAINGIRFLSMAWIILGHTYFFAMPYATNVVPLTLKKSSQWTFYAIINASTSVDTFFALSGTLVAYLTLKEMKRAGGATKFNWFMFYFHRFWRLTPPYMLILMVGTVLYTYIVYGPMQQEDDNMYMKGCRKNWWTNLLYVNNYVNKDEMCMGWTWYLANDMQMYIVSPLILVPFFYNVVAGLIASVIFLAGTITATAIIENDNKFPVQMWSPYAPRFEGNYNVDLYIPAWTRLGPYVIGLVTGYALYKCKCKFRIPKVINLCCWFLCFGVLTAIVYGPYSKDDSHIFSTDESTAYHTLFRTGWGVAVCWIIFACATGNGGWINELLSWSPYVPLGRLTYCAYLLHPLVMMVYYDNMSDPIRFSDYGIIYLFMGNLVLSYGSAFVASLFFESPMMGLEKAIFKKK